MDKVWLMERLAAYRPADREDGERRDRIAAFVSTHPRFFARDLAVGHVVGSAWVVNPARDSVLLHHHRRLDKWLQFGGHAEDDTTVLDTARRELAEESGLSAFRLLSEAIFDLDIHTIPKTPREAEHLHLDVRFAFEADDGAPLALTAESHALRWIPLDDLFRYTDEPSVRRMAEKTSAVRH